MQVQNDSYQNEKMAWRTHMLLLLKDGKGVNGNSLTMWNTWRVKSCVLKLTDYTERDLELSLKVS